MSKDLFGAELEITLVGFFEELRALLFEYVLIPLGAEWSELLIGID